MKIFTMLSLLLCFISLDAFAVRANGGLLRDKNGTITGTTAFKTVQVKAHPTAENPDPQGRYWSPNACTGSSHICSNAEVATATQPASCNPCFCCSYTLVKKIIDVKKD